MKLSVLIEGHLAGSVEMLSSRHASFSYTEAYLERAHPTPLSVRFPLREEPYDGPDVASWLWNLLPDDEEVLKRWCIRYDAPPDRPLELLGTAIGRECAGAVQFALPEIAPELLSAASGLQEITDDELWAGLRRLRGDWSFRFADAHGDTGRSLAGMQSKDALAWSGQRWAVPWGRAATTHIVKLERPRFRHEALVEHVTLETARHLGVPAAESRVLYGEEFDVLVVRRFDRRESLAGEVERVHQEDFCQALGLPPSGRHQRLGGATVADCAEIVTAFGGSGAANMVRLRDSVLFRWLVADTDGHAKNAGVLLSGADRALTPLYDAASLLADRGSTEERELGMAMWGGETWERWPLGRTDTPEGLASLTLALGSAGGQVSARAAEFAAALPVAVDRAVNALSREGQDKLDRLGLVPDLVGRAQRCATVTGSSHRVQGPLPPTINRHGTG